MAIAQGQMRSNEETVCSISWTSLVRSALTPSWIHFQGLHPIFFDFVKIADMSVFQQWTSQMSWNLVFVRKLKKLLKT